MAMTKDIGDGCIGDQVQTLEPIHPILEIGCGENPITETTPDVCIKDVDYRMDVVPFNFVEVSGNTVAIPFRDSSVGSITCQHVAEHHTHAKGNGGAIEGSLKDFFAEVYRVLKPGGLFEIMCPNFAYIAKFYVTQGVGNVDIAEQLMEWAMGGQRDQWDFHYCLLDYNIVNRLGMRLGFESCELMHPFDWFGLHVILRK